MRSQFICLFSGHLLPKVKMFKNLLLLLHLCAATVHRPRDKMSQWGSQYIKGGSCPFGTNGLKGMQWRIQDSLGGEGEGRQHTIWPIFPKTMKMKKVWPRGRGRTSPPPGLPLEWELAKMIIQVLTITSSRLGLDRSDFLVGKSGFLHSLTGTRAARQAPVG